MINNSFPKTAININYRDEVLKIKSAKKECYSVEPPSKNSRKTLSNRRSPIIHLHYHSSPPAPPQVPLPTQEEKKEDKLPQKEPFNLIKAIVKIARSCLQSLAELFSAPESQDRENSGEIKAGLKERRLLQHLVFFSIGFLMGAGLSTGVIIGLQSSMKTVATISAVGVIAKLASSIVEAVSKVHELFKKIIRELQEAWEESRPAAASPEP